MPASLVTWDQLLPARFTLPGSCSVRNTRKRADALSAALPRLSSPSDGLDRLDRPPRGHLARNGAP